MPASFPTTRWSIIQRVREGSPEDTLTALNSLCRAYWYPLYCVARRRPLTEHDAEDTVQSFFQAMLRREVFSKADESEGKLRTLLLRCFDNHCKQGTEHALRLKRGAGSEHVEFLDGMDLTHAESLYQQSHSAFATVETHYQRAWAAALLERSLKSLHADYERRGWLERYDLLVNTLLQQDEEQSLVQLAAQAGSTPGALRVTLHRMRGHYRDQIERELATTLDTDDPALIREEMHELLRAFAA